VKRERPRISANIARLFADLDLPDRIAAAAQAGFRGVEISDPHDHPAPELRDKAVFAGVPILRIDAPPPNYTGGPVGFAARPDCVDRFRRDVVRVGRQARVLGSRLVHLRSGVDGPSDAGTLIENLSFAAQKDPKSTFLVELLNPGDHPDHCLATPERATAILDAVNKPNVRLLFGSWHGERQPEGLAAAWSRCAAHVGHVLLGGGHASEDDHGGAGLLEILTGSGYDGWVCADYTPHGLTQSSLGWLTA